MNNLNQLRHMKAPDSLRTRIAHSVDTLADKERSPLPLFAFKSGVLVAGIAIFLVAISGVAVVADMFSPNISHPVKTAIEHIIPPKPQVQSAEITAVKVTPTFTPAPQPTKVVASPTPSQGSKDNHQSWGEQSLQHIREFLQEKFSGHESSNKSSKEDH